jgi:hypothetical protein
MHTKMFMIFPYVMYTKTTSAKIKIKIYFDLLEPQFSIFLPKIYNVILENYGYA